MTWSQKIGPIGTPTPSNGQKLDTATASIAQYNFCSVLIAGKPAKS